MRLTKVYKRLVGFNGGEITGKFTSQFWDLEKFHLLGSKLSFTRVKVSLRTTNWI